MTYELSKKLHGFQYEVEEQTKISFNVHCAKCGKFKLKYTKSKILPKMSRVKMKDITCVCCDKELKIGEIFYCQKCLGLK